MLDLLNAMYPPTTDDGVIPGLDGSAMPAAGVETLIPEIEPEAVPIEVDSSTSDGAAAVETETPAVEPESGGNAEPVRADEAPANP
jgi:hypothetical protein